MKYKNIVFDLYGTLIDIHTDEHSDQTWSLFAEYLRTFNIDCNMKTLRDLFFSYDKIYREKPSIYIEPEIEILDVFDQIFREQGHPLSREKLSQIGYQFRCISREYIRLYDGVINLLALLHESNCNVYLLSNAQSCFTRPELFMFHLEEYFDRIIISSEHGCMKPDPSFFNLLFQNQLENLDRKDWVMIGDSIGCDVMGAASIGMDSILLCNDLEPNQQLPSQCIAVVKEQNRMKLIDFLF